MTNQEYKELSIREFSKAAKVYETNDAGVYRMCRKDYPDVRAFFNSVCRVLRPGGRLILRDMTAKTAAVRWFMNHHVSKRDAFLFGNIIFCRIDKTPFRNTGIQNFSI